MLFFLATTTKYYIEFVTLNTCAFSFVRNTGDCYDTLCDCDSNAYLPHYFCILSFCVSCRCVFDRVFVPLNLSFTVAVTSLKFGTVDFLTLKVLHF